MSIGLWLDFRQKKDLAEASLDHVKDGLEASGDIEFPEDAVQMALDRFFDDEEGFTDFLICAACSEETKDLLLPRRQPLLCPQVSVFFSGIGDGLFVKESGHQFPLYP